MAELCNKAFGRYLKILRERRGLTLEEVETLSQTFADPIKKGYLSRCENGHQRLALSKLIPLCRVYEVPAGVLVERMELDLELDRIGGPDTDGKSFAELFALGRETLDSGDRWQAYGSLRDACSRAKSAPVSDQFQNADEQEMRAYMACGTAACGLGRYLFALNEFTFVRGTDLIGPKFLPLVSERLSLCYRRLGDLDRASKAAARAVEEAETFGDSWTLGYVYHNLGSLADEQDNPSLAAEHFAKAFKHFTESEEHAERALAMGNLAQMYFYLERLGAARRALVLADRLCTEGGFDQTLATCKILLGEILFREKKFPEAEAAFRQATEIAHEHDDRTILFRANFHLLNVVQLNGKHAAARAIGRRLDRLSSWIPKNTPELLAYRETRR